MYQRHSALLLLSLISAALGASVPKSFEIEAQVVHPVPQPDTNTPLVGLQFDGKTSSSDLQDFNSVALLGKAKIGTPKDNTPEQEFTFSFVTDSIQTWVVDGSKCTTDKCKKRKTFAPGNSSTFAQFNPPRQITQVGEFVKDTFNFAGLTVKDQTFTIVQSDNYPLLMDPQLGIEPLFDGQFSLLFTTTDNVDKSPAQNVMDQLNEKLITFWLAQGQPNTSSVITFGAKDTKNCKDEWSFNNVQQDFPLWAVNMSKLEWGDQKKEFNPNKGVLVDVTSAGIMVTWDIYKAMKDALKPDEKNIVKCSARNGQPPLKFSIGDKVYEVPAENYVVDLKEGNDKCWLMVMGVEPPKGQEDMQIVKLGVPFLRSYCTALDFGGSDVKSTRRVGFAPPNTNSAVNMALSWPIMAVANVLLWLALKSWTV